jgi:uncharacterized membrane protein
VTGSNHSGANVLAIRVADTHPPVIGALTVQIALYRLASEIAASTPFKRTWVPSTTIVSASRILSVPAIAGAAAKKIAARMAPYFK